MNKNIDIPINVIYHEKITENGIYNEWIKRKTAAYFQYRENWKKYPEQGIVSEFPLNLDIEPTNHCNLKCPFCYRTIAIHNNEKSFNEFGYMSLETFERILQQICVNGVSQVPAIKLTHRGEPLLNKNIGKMIKLAKSIGVVDVIMNTNGTVLTADLAEEILDAGIDKLLFSFDSPYPAKYENIRIGASYEKVLNTITHFVNLRNKKKAYGTLIRVGMVITQDTSSDEPADFYNLFKNLADIVSYNKVHEEITEKNGEEFYDFKSRRFADSQLWQRMTINWNGEAEICCENYKQEWELGNIWTSTVHDIWVGERFGIVRTAHENGEWWKIPQCQKCTIPHMK